MQITFKLLTIQHIMVFLVDNNAIIFLRKLINYIAYSLKVLLIKQYHILVDRFQAEYDINSIFNFYTSKSSYTITQNIPLIKIMSVTTEKHKKKTRTIVVNNCSKNSVVSQN